MIKGLEVLDKLEECAYAMKYLPMSNWIDLAENEAELDLKIMDWVETIKLELFKGKQALQRLEAIDNANPSEALECSLKLYKMVESAGNDNGFNLNEAWEYHKTIKQALLKAQEQEKENQELKRKYENRDYLYQNEVSKNGNLAGKIFEKDLKIQKLEKAIKKTIELLSIDGKGTKKQVLNLLKEVEE